MLGHFLMCGHHHPLDKDRIRIYDTGMTNKRNLKQEKIFAAALELYVNWLNAITKRNDPTDNYPAYTAKDFTEGYGSYIIRSCKNAANADKILHVSLTDGDEGGPHDLIFSWDENRMVIGFMLQGFDTNWQMIYNDSKFILE
jgi:hypothetical protein